MPRKNSGSTFEIRDRRRPGYLRVYNDLYDRFGAELGPYGLAVYMALCRYANRDSECWPSHETIAKGTGMSRRQVIREVAKLERLQVIAIERSKHTSHVYILLDTCDTQSHLPRDTQSHPCDTQSHKQDLIKKNTSNISNKKEGYRPPEYADIILG
jgi:hypothetical protein